MIIPPPEGPGAARPTPERGPGPTAIRRASAQVTLVFGTHKFLERQAERQGKRLVRKAKGPLAASQQRTARYTLVREHIHRIRRPD